MSEDTKPLIGDVSTVFQFGKPEDYAESVERARLEQQEICGYPLEVAMLRQTHMQDDQGRDVYEVYATFKPAPAPVTIPTDGTVA